MWVSRSFCVNVNAGDFVSCFVVCWCLFFRIIYSKSMKCDKFSLFQNGFCILNIFSTSFTWQDFHFLRLPSSLISSPKSSWECAYLSKYKIMQSNVINMSKLCVIRWKDGECKRVINGLWWAFRQYRAECFGGEFQNLFTRRVSRVEKT